MAIGVEFMNSAIAFSIVDFEMPVVIAPRFSATLESSVDGALSTSEVMRSCNWTDIKEYCNTVRRIYIYIYKYTYIYKYEFICECVCAFRKTTNAKAKGCSS